MQLFSVMKSDDKKCSKLRIIFNHDPNPSKVFKTTNRSLLNTALNSSCCT